MGNNGSAVLSAHSCSGARQLGPKLSAHFAFDSRAATKRLDFVLKSRGYERTVWSRDKLKERTVLKSVMEERVCAGERTGGWVCVLPPVMKTTISTATTQQSTTL